MIKRIIAVAAVLVMTTTWAQAQEVKVGVNPPDTAIGAEFAQAGRTAGWSCISSSMRTR